MNIYGTVISPTSTTPAKLPLSNALKAVLVAYRARKLASKSNLKSALRYIDSVDVPARPLIPMAGAQLVGYRLCLYVRIAVRGPFQSWTCMEESIALAAALKSVGVASKILLGKTIFKSPTEGNYYFHSWVEVSGIPINDTGQARKGNQIVGEISVGT